MGTLAHIAPVLGLLAGIITARLAKSELKQGEKYFKILQYALGIAVIGTVVWQHINEQTINLDVPIFLFFIPVGTRYHKKHSLLAGIAAVYIIISLMIF